MWLHKILRTCDSIAYELGSLAASNQPLLCAERARQVAFIHTETKLAILLQRVAVGT
jgi:hypothetical protein